MTADALLLGRTNVRAKSRVDDLGGFARFILGFVLAGVVMLEASPAGTAPELGTYLHRGIGSWTGLPIILSPLELLLLLGLIGTAVAEAIRPPGDRVAPSDLALRLRGGWPILLFTFTLVFGFARGVFADGDPYVGLWELRYLLYVPACYLIARAGLRKPEHIAGLLRVGLAAAVVFAAEGAYRRIALIDTHQLVVIPEFAFEHEDVLFLSAFTLLLLASFVFGALKHVRMLGLLVTPLLLYTLLATERRAGIIVLLIGLLVIALTTLFVRRRAFFLAAAPVLTIAVLYLGLFWNASGVLGQPARAIKSLYEPDPRDAQSNLYRLLENFDIEQTIHSDPILGVGFGRPFLMVASLPDISWWPFWHFETHNNVLWVWMKTGLIGYVLFWVMMGGAISRAAYAAKRLNDPTLRCAALFCLCAIVGTLVFAYVDLGLVSGRVTVLLGTSLGILAVVERIDANSARPELRAA